MRTIVFLFSRTKRRLDGISQYSVTKLTVRSTCHSLLQCHRAPYFPSKRQKINHQPHLTFPRGNMMTELEAYFWGVVTKPQSRLGSPMNPAYIATIEVSSDCHWSMPSLFSPGTKVLGCSAKNPASSTATFTFESCDSLFSLGKIWRNWKPLSRNLPFCENDASCTSTCTCYY